MKQICLYAGRDDKKHQTDICVLVDDEDYEELNKYEWYLMSIYHTKSKIFYARRYGNDNAILMHRVVLGLQSSKEHGDHVDGNGLNNQKYNLRSSTHSQNQANSKKKPNSFSEYKGVVKREKRRKFQSEIRVGGKKINLGNFTDEQQAALAYNKAAIRYFGEFAKLNILKVG